MRDEISGMSVTGPMVAVFPKNLRYKTCNGGMSTGQGFGRVDGDK